jgi:hypothetical protein
LFNQGKTMNITSKRSIFSILAGMIVSLLVLISLRPTCLGPLLGVFVAAYLAKVSSPKEGAPIGAIIFVPIGLYYALQIKISQELANEPLQLLTYVLGLLVGFLLICGLGALYGLIVGRLFQFTKNNGLIF